MAFPESFLQELKMRNDITETVSSYVSLKRRGRNMVGLCPFHGEKTPSFNVYTENGSFYCFGCGVGGDVITFIMKIENLDYVDAVKLLAQRAGMEVPENSYDDSMNKLRSRIFEANREAARFYYSTLLSPKGASGLEYLHNRQLSDRTIRHFGLGFADDDWTSLCTHLRGKGFKDSEITAANLGVKRRNGNGIYDRFTNRVMFPIIDLRGNVIAFGGRIMTDEKPKYLNTSDTPVFKKSANLFSLNNAKNSGNRTLILCEGYMDVISVCQAGFTNAVATLGTALTVEQAVLMKRYADEVIICYDADEAGQKATARAIPILRNAGLLIRVLTVPRGKDPDEFIKSNGKDGPAAFRALIDKSANDVEYRLNKLKQQYNTETTDGKIAYLEEAAKVISGISSPLERDVYISKISNETGVEKSSFNQQFKNIFKRSNREAAKKQMNKIQADLSGRSDKINSDHYKKPRSSSAEEALVVFLINNPDLAPEISDGVKPEQFQNSLMKRYYEYMLGRIERGLDPLNNVTADFTNDEASKLYQLLSQSIPAASTKEAMREYINVINEESKKLTAENAASLSDAEIQAYLDEIRKNKQ
ncbi:MAG: DNA primase [Clostridiales bacterium]|nr:DNA primase [Clostridiales bacterium]